MKKLFLTLKLLCILTGISLAQNGKITGKVTAAETGEPILGATIVVEGTTSGTTTDDKGEFTINVPANKTKIIVSFIGYETQKIEINKESFYAVVLKESQLELNEVVVVAGGIQRARREQGYSTTKLSSAELTAGKSSTVAAGLTAKIPGLQVNAISSGVNPNYRLVLRGNRSLTGNNQALIVVDNAIVSSDILNNINPEDIEEIQVLSGASGAALYGSEASNGVLMVTTKKGKAGKTTIKLSHTLTAEQVSFFPKLQNKFGAGTLSDGQYYDPHENQQFGPAFDGSIRDLGDPLENGDQQTVKYSAVDDRYKFWETGIQNQTDLSISFGDDKSTTYLSGQYFTATGTTPGDEYERYSFRVNGTRKVFSKLNIDYSMNYVQNLYDICNSTGTIYDNLINIPANIPILSYKDWKNNKWATPDGWFNPWYKNPYWIADNYRQDTKNAYINGKVELKYDVAPWMYVLYRGAISERNYQNKSWSPKFTYSEYSQSLGKTNLSGSVLDEHYTTSRVNHDLQLGFNKKIQDFALNLILGYSTNMKKTKQTYNYASALLIPGLYNISNRVGDASVYEENTKYLNYGYWGDFLVGYKNYLFLHMTGRKDYTSLLKKANRTYFYPSVDLSMVVTDAFDFLKDNTVLDYLKIRGALSKTGNVNLDPYKTDATFGSVTGYSNGTYYSQSSTLVSEDLKPEITKGWEIGGEFKLFDSRIEGQLNYYFTSTTGQAVEAGVSPSSGYSTFLINAGEVTNKGIETALHFTPIKTKDWQLVVGGNYTYNKNLLVSLFDNGSSDDRIAINGSSVIYAQEGYELNQIIVTDYNRDEKGRVIVDANTGYPSQASETKIIGNTTPRHRVGLDFSLSWKSFTLSNLFEYRGGYSAAAIALGSGLDFTGASARSAYYNRERFVFPNSSIYDETSGAYIANKNVTVADGGAGFWTSSTYNRGVYSNYVYKADYWKWREISLSYKLPEKLISKLHYIQSASISFQGRNLILWASSDNEYTDPDYSANNNNAIGVSNLDQAPPTRYIGTTISLTF